MRVWDIRTCPLQAVAERHARGLAGRVCFGWARGGGTGGLHCSTGHRQGVGGKEGMLVPGHPWKRGCRDRSSDGVEAMMR